MGLIKYNNLTDYTPVSFRSVIDRFFDDSFGKMGNVESFVPKVDISETEKEFEIQLAVPGMKKDEFKIELEDNRITISGERKFESKNEGKNFHSVETSYGAFSRSFYLPDYIKKEDIDASYENGILNIKLPKEQKKLLSKAIKVK